MLTNYKEKNVDLADLHTFFSNNEKTPNNEKSLFFKVFYHLQILFELEYIWIIHMNEHDNRDFKNVLKAWRDISFDVVNHKRRIFDTNFGSIQSIPTLFKQRLHYHITLHMNKT